MLLLVGAAAPLEAVPAAEQDKDVIFMEELNMSLFSKKPPCPICGSKISWLFPSKIEGEYVCNLCHNKIDMDDDKKNQLTMQSFRDYLAFYEQNQTMKDQFVISEKIDFGLWDTKIIFDYQNKLFCMSNNPDKTVFEGKQLKSFTIKEDSTPLFEGSAAGIYRYASTVTERAMAMSPQISLFYSNAQMTRALDRLDDGKENGSVTVQHFDVPEPFRAFNVELYFDHPYWSVMKCDMEGPRFNNTHPDLNDYLCDYQRSIEELEKLVAALRTVAFPSAPEQSIASGMAGAVYTTAAPPVDTIEEIKKYKALMEDGVISQQEFDAKKRQLLGI